MKLCVLVPHLLHGGAEGMAVDLANGLAQRGCDVVLTTIAAAAAPRFAARVRPDVRRAVLGAAPYSAVGVARFARLARREGWDAVIAHLTPTLVHGAALSVAAPRVATVFVEHLGVRPPDAPGVRERAIAPLLGRFDGVVCVSRALRDGYVGRFFPRVAARTHVIHNGVSADRPDDPVGARARARAELGVAEQAPVAVLVGRLVAQKGHAAFLAALAPHRAALAAKGARVLIVGGGELHGELEAAVERLGLGGVVRMTGPRDDVPALLAASDLFAMPSHWEGLPIALLEAMLIGLPVLAMGVGGVAEAVVEGTGVVVPAGRHDLFAARLVELLGSGRAALLALGARAAAHARANFSVERMTDAYLSLSARVAAERHDRLAARRPAHG